MRASGGAGDAGVGDVGDGSASVGAAGAIPSGHGSGTSAAGADGGTIETPEVFQARDFVALGLWRLRRIRREIRA